MLLLPILPRRRRRASGVTREDLDILLHGINSLTKGNLEVRKGR